MPLGFKDAPHLMLNFYRLGSSPAMLAEQILTALGASQLHDLDGYTIDSGAPGVAVFSGLDEAIEWLRQIGPQAHFELGLEISSKKGKRQSARLGNRNDAPGEPGKDTVMLSTGGSMFTFIGPRQGPPAQLLKAKAVGMQTYQRFVGLCDAVAPTYAAILLDWELESPKELMQNCRSGGFQNFYVADRLGSFVLHKRDEIYRGCYIEQRVYGAYVSCSCFFNPAGLSSTSVQKDRSSAFGMVLARHFMGHQANS